MEEYYSFFLMDVVLDRLLNFMLLEYEYDLRGEREIILRILCN